MITKKIFLKSVGDIKNFVSATTLCNGEIDLISGRYTVNAKSIMGVFSIELNDPIILKIYSDDCDNFLSEIQKYIINE
ncbi:HPr family phosphocarrier protein [Clostridium estertheticum]|uniref:HPr family phosphocarrier protein n=1 Tax=Clostridium estertheticum TaxID=238834 RepID=UPI001CF304BB|nr:HPr family phosphocarrier protein [Clostridium estertheticum]MCB2362480.1 HPr family phosphocarrier protein [Clostridium estertheticum]